METAIIFILLALTIPFIILQFIVLYFLGVDLRKYFGETRGRMLVMYPMA
jgi:hypothetical protein